MTDNDSVPVIVHIIYRLSSGGMENGLVNLINGLPSKRFNHVIFCLTESSSFADRLVGSNVRIVELRKQPGKDVKVYFRVWKLLRKIRPVIVHTRNLGTVDLSIVAAVARVPVRIHSEHGWEASDPQGSKRKYLYLRRLCDFAIDAYVAVSMDIAEWMHATVKIPERKLNQIHNGVDTDKFCPDGDPLVLPFKLPKENSIILGSFGRLDPIKRFDLLIEAVACLVESKRSMRSVLRLVVVGDGPELDNIVELAETKGISDLIWFAGHRDDVHEIYRSLDLFVLASINEGISNTILEAMATGVPVIAGNVGGNRELIIDGVTGKLIDIGSAKDLADEIIKFVDNRERMLEAGKRARDHVKRNFSLDVMVTSYAKLYSQCMSLHPRAG